MTLCFTSLASGAANAPATKPRNAPIAVPTPGMIAVPIAAPAAPPPPKAQFSLESSSEISDATGPIFAEFALCVTFTSRGVTLNFIGRTLSLVNSFSKSD